MKPKNYGKDISSVNTPVRFHLPDGSTLRFNNSLEAQAWFNENYSDGYSMTEYIPTQGDSDHPILLPEVTVTAQAPKRSLSSPSRKGSICGQELIIARGSINISMVLLILTLYLERVELRE